MRNTIKYVSVALLFFLCYSLQGQTQIVKLNIGDQSTPQDDIYLELVSRFQHNNSRPNHSNDKYDRSIYSPKSVKFSVDGKKFYIQSLEGYTTSVYRSDSLKRIKVIRHSFGPEQNRLFKNNENTIFGYKYYGETAHKNYFKGKPVESCLSHNGKYLWVSYYRRDYDKNAISPSAVAIIDTEYDSIVRVMPTGPLPKMLAASPNNKFLAVTHWGDNTVGIIDISSNDVMDFKYIAHSIIDFQSKNNFNELVNRDQNCSNCLRGTLFTPDNKYLLIGKMGGNGIAVVSVGDFIYQGTIVGIKQNVRHLIQDDNILFISTNKTGYVQKTDLNIMLDSFNGSPSKGNFLYKNWTSSYVGTGVRTIAKTNHKNYVFAAVNNSSELVILDAKSLSIIGKMRVDSYPVGMAISPDDKYLIVTSQGRRSAGGNSVMVFEIKENTR